MTRTHVLLLGMLGAQAFSAELVPVVAEGQAGARIVAADYPESLPAELQSGLTNRLYVRVSLRDDATTLQQRTVEIAIRYDLWEQEFRITRTVEGSAVENLHLGSLAQVNAFLASIELPRLFSLRPVAANRDLILSAELLLNPIGREKLRMIRKWVAENSAPGIGTEQGISSSNTLFNRIFEQYADGSDLAATWRITLTSPPFRRVGVANEGR